MEISKKDWALFRAKLPAWQERHMARLNASYIDILNGPGLASEKFWELEKRIKQDKRHPGVRVNASRPSYVLDILLYLRNDNVITDADLGDFSEDIQRAIAHFINE